MHTAVAWVYTCICGRAVFILITQRRSSTNIKGISCLCSDDIIINKTLVLFMLLDSGSGRNGFIIFQPE